MREWRAKNQEKQREIILKQTEKYHKNKTFREQKKKLAKNWRKQHPIKKRKYDKNYRETHKEYYKNYNKNYREGDKREEILKNKRHDYKKNRKKIRKYQNSKYKNDNLFKERVKQKASEYYNKTIKPIKIDVFTHYSKGEPRCSCCEETGTIEFLTIEHIDGRDKDEKRKSGHNLYRWLKSQNYPEGYEIQCWNCNCSDGFFGVCSHKKQYEFPSGKEGGNKKMVLKHYSKGSMMCICCKESNIGFLSIDHIHGRGKQFKDNKLSGRKIYSWLVKNNLPIGYRVLCFNCNSGRNLTENKVCPHTLNFK
jgi:hypothetical protein